MEDVWKEFERNPITHSAAHHLVTIAELLEQHGYARVSDVAKALNITRGSASLTLKALRQRGLVVEDENRFLKLSSEGERIAASVRGRAYVIHAFLTDVLGVHAELAEVDTCKIEHLVSLTTAEKLGRFVRFIESGDPRAAAFLAGWRDYHESCTHDPEVCPACQAECLTQICTESIAGSTAR